MTEPEKLLQVSYRVYLGKGRVAQDPKVVEEIKAQHCLAKANQRKRGERNQCCKGYELLCTLTVYSLGPKSAVQPSPYLIIRR